MQELQHNHAYLIEWRARDVGYGVEEGDGEYVYRGRESLADKLILEPIAGGTVIYLFDDEILSVSEAVPTA